MNRFLTYFNKQEISKNGWTLMLLASVLTILGIIMIYSASYFWALDKYGDAYYFTKRQLIFALIGLGLMFFLSKINLNDIKKRSKSILIISLVLLGLVVIPGVGIVRGGSRSWFGIGSFAIQPSEIFKLTIVIFTAYMLEKYYAKSKYFYRVIVPILIPSLIGFGLIMLQPDLGSGVVMLMAVVIIPIASKTSIKNYVTLGIIGACLFAVLIISAPYRLNRITAFVDPWEDPLGSGFQIIQSLYAIGPGGFLGVGFNGSIQKHFYLPEPQTDFIFAILAEEMGLIGGGIIILLFALFIYYGFKVINESKDLFRAFLSLGIVALIAVQAIINLGVVVGLFPVTGITLPFISYGGSSLVITLASIGILIACDQKEVKTNESRH